MIKEYEQFVQSRKNKDYATISSRLNNERAADLLHAFFGVMSEIRELSEAVDEVNKLEECGDLLFFAVMGLEACGSPLSSIPVGDIRVRSLEGILDPNDALKGILYKGVSVDHYLEDFKQLFINIIASVTTEYTLPKLISSNQTKLDVRHKEQEKYEEESANRNTEEEREVMKQFISQGDAV